ncbi:hypothetical protein SY88_10135 [Clostridiales bacterium PH28_bin88]|nr:hypothetical protein SY88_10135 [Clostridiales bacterium PH28_bin88]
MESCEGEGCDLDYWVLGGSAVCAIVLFVARKRLAALYKRFSDNKKRIKILTSDLLKLAFIPLAVYLLWQNWPAIVFPAGANNLQELIGRLVNRPFTQLISVGTYLGLLIILYFLVQLPFMDLEQLKIFGVEYKRQAEQQKEVAQSTLSGVKVREKIRLCILESLADPAMGNEIAKMVTDGKLEPLSAWAMLARLIEGTYMQVAGLRLEAGIAVIEGEKVNEAEGTIGPVTEQAMLKAHREQKTENRTLGESSVLAFPVPGISGEVSLIFWMQNSVGIEFTEVDETMLQIAWQIILNYADLKVYTEGTSLASSAKKW